MNAHNHHLSPWQKIMAYFDSIFRSTTMHVKISKEGMRILKDKQLTRKIVDNVLEHKKDLDEGKSIQINHEGKDIVLKQSAAIEVPVDNSENK